MRIDPIARTNARQDVARENTGRDENLKTAERVSSRKNLPVSTFSGKTETADPAAPFRRYRPNSAFLTQLIAVREDWPDVRVRRRTEPEAAIRLYRETEASPRRMQAGRTIVLSA
ncbi:hypothetical protein GR183_08715 [Stappia sp. GBMRC 2046]|uniref:Uncharacterized protein n=1 Tax=Stappia sediminis TaxID=2692190 RepID=A0A7X3LTU9_9HYPH|nr:hypothetical protein [Stappia sediminis]MXN64987.1 hypothetical protein [Stappia sediminis]